MPRNPFPLPAEPIAQTRNQAIGAETKHATQCGIAFPGKKQVRSGDDDPSLRIGLAKIACKKQFIEGIGREKQSEFNVMLLQFADDTEHDGFLGKGGLRNRIGRNSVVVATAFLEIRRKRRNARGIGSARRLRGNFLLIGGTEIRNLSWEMQLDDV